LNHLFPLKDFIRQEKRLVAIETSSLHWRDEIKRFSSKRKEEMIFGGLIGNIEYKGDLQLFMPFLNIGEHIHIGEKTTFGLGKYEIIQNH
jgi:CRISPR/Cas system endoribonuclease Cas6 (RAMP superfamily)